MYIQKYIYLKQWKGKFIECNIFATAGSAWKYDESGGRYREEETRCGSYRINYYFSGAGAATLAMGNRELCVVYVS